MVYLLSFVGAVMATAFIVALSRLLLNFFLPEAGNNIPSLCLGIGFLIGHYSFSGSLADPETAVAITKFCGSAMCLIILGASIRYRANRIKVA